MGLAYLALSFSHSTLQTFLSCLRKQLNILSALIAGQITLSGLGSALIAVLGILLLSLRSQLAARELRQRWREVILVLRNRLAN